MTSDPADTRIVPMGERALLVETGGTPGALALLELLRRDPLSHQSDLVPGACSLLMRFSEPVDLDAAAEQVRALRPERFATLAGDEVSVEVVYDGPDLAEVGRLTGLGADGVITAHTGTPWKVAFCGFAPGFGYLAGGDSRLEVRRRESPRPQIEAGSVGLAGEYSGIYPTASPGGWQLIGHTDAELWNVDRDPAALLRPGMTVRFRATRPVVTTSSTAAPRADVAPERPVRTSELAPPGQRRIIVIRPGMLCTVQDLGRPGTAALGVSPSGAADRGAAMRANRIVGNDVGAAVLEVLLGGVELRFEDAALIAVTGAPVDIRIEADRNGGGANGGDSNGGDRNGGDVDGRDTAVAAPVMNAPIPVPTGARLRLSPPARGLRSYLAIRGGIDVAPVLGSRSTDLLAGIGPAALRAGDALPVGDKHWGMPHPISAPQIPDPIELEFLPGPQVDWFAGDIVQIVCAATWTVSPSSNRVGVRLTGRALARIRSDELPSQGLVRGAVQVAPSGELVIFLADHPVTGGYPVVAVLTESAVDLAAQARPGAAVRFIRRRTTRPSGLPRQGT